jgi:hypothetical protein
MPISNSGYILIGLLVITIIYLLCYHSAESLYLPDKVIGARLDEQGIMQIPETADRRSDASLSGLVKKENYVVEKCCGRRQENCCGWKNNPMQEQYAVGNCCGKVPSGYNVEGYKVDKYMIDNMSNLDGLTSYDAKIAPIVDAKRNTGEHFGSNPLNALSTMDFTMPPFSQNELEPFAEHAVSGGRLQDRVDAAYQKMSDLMSQNASDDAIKEAKKMYKKLLLRSNMPGKREDMTEDKSSLKQTIKKLREQVKARNASMTVLKRNPNSLQNVRSLMGLNKADKHSIELIKMQFVAKHGKVPSDKVKQLKQEKFEEEYVFDNRIFNNYEDYIPNPENSMVI